MRTLARHGGLFLPWLRFAAKLMPGGFLPRADTELVILRVAHNSASEYEWRQHEQIGRQAGLSAEEIQRVRDGPAAESWTGRRRVLLQAVDELHADRTLSDATWALLREHGFGDVELIELCMLTGHYEMLAMTLNALRVQPDERSVASGGALRRLAPLLRRGRA